MKVSEVNAIRSALGVLVDSGSVVELRMLNTPRGTVSGYFDDIDKLASAAAAWSGRAESVCVTLNPVRRDLLARAANRVVEFVRHTTSDGDILRRRWLLIDFDPVRPNGISATEAEHALALERARGAREWLHTQGWRGLVLADSGNGAHLLPRLDLPNDAESLALLKKCLAALSLRFSDEHVVVDECTVNAARLVKLYGTKACKGDATADRPHRVSGVLDVDQDLAR